ncbi:MAG: hypothetical protein JSU87_06410 [Gemmatimonadota bacterium]|nr:MAG: hypothetical protein JSU87_06410 [Gemmatimonadota bacterium]
MVTERARSMRQVTRGLAMALVMMAAVACANDGSVTGPGGPAGTGSVTLSVALTGTAPSPAASLHAHGLELTDGASTLVIESADLVVREIEFERIETPGCDSDSRDDDCEEYEVGPFLVALPLDGSVTREITAQVDTGTYDEIEFDIHKPEDDTAADRDFISQNPNFADISIRVTGTYNGQDFLYTTDLNEDQEIHLSDPLVVQPDPGPVNVTLTIDLSSWFRTPSGLLIDPRTANKGEPNENLVEDNIEVSIEGFRDDDSDGVRHSDDDDESDDS